MCGLLLGREGPPQGGRGQARVHLITRCANVSVAGLGAGVELDPGHLVRAERMGRARGLKVLGTWHAHPSAVGARALSRRDMGLAWGGAFLLVVVPPREVQSPRGLERVAPGLAAWRCEARERWDWDQKM